MVRWTLDGVALAGAVDGIHDVALGASHVRALAFAGLLVEAGVRLDALAHALAFAILLLLVELGASVGAVARAVGVVAQLRRRAVVRAEAAAVVGVLSLRSRAPVQGCEGMFNIYSFFFFLLVEGRKEIKRMRTPEGRNRSSRPGSGPLAQGTCRCRRSCSRPAGP